MSKTIIHKHNCSEMLNGCSISFPTILLRHQQHAGIIYHCTERELGLSDSYTQVQYIYREDLLSTSKRVIKKLNSLEKGANYKEKWEALCIFLENAHPQNSTNEGIDSTEEISPHSLSVGEKLPIKFISLKEDDRSAYISLHTITPGQLHCFFYLDIPTKREIEEFKEDILVTLFVRNHIPFLIFTLPSLYFETAIIQKELLSETKIVFYHLIDTKTDIIKAQGSLGIPKEFLVKIHNILEHSPYKSLEEMDANIPLIRALVSYEDMMHLGSTLLLRGEKKIT